MFSSNISNESQCTHTRRWFQLIWRILIKLDTFRMSANKKVKPPPPANETQTNLPTQDFWSQDSPGFSLLDQPIQGNSSKVNLFNCCVSLSRCPPHQVCLSWSFFLLLGERQLVGQTIPELLKKCKTLPTSQSYIPNIQYIYICIYIYIYI